MLCIPFTATRDIRLAKDRGAIVASIGVQFLVHSQGPIFKVGSFPSLSMEGQGSLWTYEARWRLVQPGNQREPTVQQKDLVQWPYYLFLQPDYRPV